jgi:CheY-like chemotaxis protein
LYENHSQFNNILVVDYDEISNFVSKTILEKAHLAPLVQTVYNGRQALNFLKIACVETQPNIACPTLLFLDLNMPIMDGFEFLEAFTSDIHLRQIDVAIVVLTSSAHWEDEEKANRYPIVGFMTKPVTIEKLANLLNG